MQILDGKKAREHYKKILMKRVQALPKKPLLGLVQIGNNPESTIYISQKKKFAKEIGAKVEHIHLDEKVSFDILAEKIQTLNEREDVHGIIIQLPLPQTLDRNTCIELIDPNKDVDGLTEENQNLLAFHKPRFVPATAKGVNLLFEYYDIKPSGKQAVVFGRSRLVGYPIAKLLESMGAHVTVCHSETSHPKDISNKADIVVVAIGKPEYIDKTYIKPGAVVIDVGINSISGEKFEEELTQRKIVGDVSFASVSPIVSAISPVPGGVGPMTVLSLFDNLVLSAENMCRKN